MKWRHRFLLKKDRELKREFEQRVKVSIQEPFFLHWLLFFHRDQQGMRGIERYVQNRSKYDDRDLRELAVQWEKLRPRLIQQVDYDEQGVFVEDLFSKEDSICLIVKPCPTVHLGRGRFVCWKNLRVVTI